MDTTGVAYGRIAASIEPGDYYSSSAGAPSKPSATIPVGKSPSNRPVAAGKAKEQEQEVEEEGAEEREPGGVSGASAGAAAQGGSGGDNNRVSREFFERHR